MEFSSLLTVDIGGGTQDILLWRRGLAIENSVKLVLPSPTRVVAARLYQARQARRAAHLAGPLMGGGAMAKAVRAHLDAGLKVSAQPSAALSLADDLEQVVNWGIKLTEDAPEGAVVIPTGDLDLEALGQALAPFEIRLPQTVAAAVCDHGFSPGYSNRKFRFQMWRRFLEAGGRLDDLVWNAPPQGMTRLAALQEAAPGAWLMDTAAAAAWGALQDPDVAARRQEGICIVNVGNMHTVGFLIQDERVLGIYEHHSGCLNPDRLEDQVARFIRGELSDDEVFADQGHGCARLPEAPTEIAGPVWFTGPRRRMAAGLEGWRVANPQGDVMLSGCHGMLAAVLAHTGQGTLAEVD